MRDIIPHPREGRQDDLTQAELLQVLTPVLATIESCVGFDQMMKIVQALGGRSVYFPREVKTKVSPPISSLMEIMGADLTMRLAAALRGRVVYISHLETLRLKHLRRVAPPASPKQNKTPHIPIPLDENALCDGLTKAELKRWFSPMLSAIEAVIGFDLTYRLIEQAGGKSVYIPVNPKRDCTLSEIVGSEATVKLFDEFGGRRLDIPPGPFASTGWRRRRGIEMLKAGSSLSEVGLALRVGRSTVQEWKRSIR